MNLLDCMFGSLGPSPPGQYHPPWGYQSGYSAYPHGYYPALQELARIESSKRIDKLYGVIPKKEDIMEFKADYIGTIKKIGNHFLIKLGCNEVIADDIKSAGKAITKLLTEAYKEKE